VRGCVSRNVAFARSEGRVIADGTGPIRPLSASGVLVKSICHEVYNGWRSTSAHFAEEPVKGRRGLALPICVIREWQKTAGAPGRGIDLAGK
jgi:hypothetical protein